MQILNNLLRLNMKKELRNEVAKQNNFFFTFPHAREFSDENKLMRIVSLKTNHKIAHSLATEYSKKET